MNKKTVHLRIYDVRETECHNLDGKPTLFRRTTLTKYKETPYLFDYNVLIQPSPSSPLVRGEDEYELFTTDSGIPFYKKKAYKSLKIFSNSFLSNNHGKSQTKS